ncbi:MAG TPA: class I SAM-dependent methyltransferase [Polyangiaceae bacterium]|nr:class I SAM-dependent methyltransferase [Polyangiaceae bacterium]
MYQPETAAPSEPVSHATPLRIARSAGDWVSFQLHREALERFVPRGARVLEVSAGVGHYTEALHHLGCKISVLDESLDELEANRARARARGFAASIEGWAQRDICALGDFADASFDAVVAYGAVLSHALDRRDRALGECMRVLRPRGVLVLDALSLWGSMRRNLPQMLARDLVQTRAIIRSGNAPRSLFSNERPPQAHDQQPARERPSQPRASEAPPSHERLAAITMPSPPFAAEPPAAEPYAAADDGASVASSTTGAAPRATSHEPPHSEPARASQPAFPAPEPPPRERHSHLFRAAELEAFLRRAGLEILSLSASSALSTGVEMPLTSDPGTWSALLEYERAACVERGYLDSGHHLIAIARR